MGLRHEYQVWMCPLSQRLNHGDEQSHQQEISYYQFSPLASHRLHTLLKASFQNERLDNRSASLARSGGK